jgi:hypothetical protein
VAPGRIVPLSLRPIYLALLKPNSIALTTEGAAN